MGVLADTTTYINSDILADLGSLISQITTWITGNTYLAIFFTMALIAVAIALFKKLRGILRG